MIMVKANEHEKYSLLLRWDPTLIVINVQTGGTFTVLTVASILCRWLWYLSVVRRRLKLRAAMADRVTNYDVFLFATAIVGK